MEDALLLPSAFSKEVTLKKGGQVWTEPQQNKGRFRKILKPTMAKILESKGNYLRVSIPVNSKNRLKTKVDKPSTKQDIQGWVLKKNTTPSSKDFGHLIATKTANIRAFPSIASAKIGKVKSSHRLEPLSHQGKWWEVRTSSGQNGFVAESLIWSRLVAAQRVRTPQGYLPPDHEGLALEDIKETFHDPLWASSGDATLSLKATPDMGSPTIIEAPPWSQFIVQGEARQKWNLSQRRRGAPVWWPEDIHYSTLPLPTPQKNKRYRLGKKQILQEIQSPKDHGLRFATTKKGVYVSRNSLFWRKLPQFNSAQTLAANANGDLFVGDQISRDNGQTFKKFIRWDKLLATLKDSSVPTRNQLIIKKIIPSNTIKSSIEISLGTDKKDNLQLRSKNMGKEWTLLGKEKISL